MVVAVTMGAILLGYTGEKVEGPIALIGASYVMAKITQIPRIAATVALTPSVAAWLNGRSSPAE